MLELVLVLLFLFPVAWLLSEFQSHRWISVVLGACAIAVCAFVGYGAGRIPMGFQLNTEFTGASRRLIDSVILQLEAGNTDKVLADLKALQPTVYENYENYPRYTEIVDKFVAKLDDSELQNSLGAGQ